MRAAGVAGELFPPALPDGILLLRGQVDSAGQAALVDAVDRIAAAAPFRHPRTKGKGTFSAAITNCGAAGWWSDHRGYRYTPRQPEGDIPWPPLPHVFQDVVAAAVAASPWPGFVPDVCLINRYGPDAKMGLHQDRDERDFTQPIVTVSLGASADFLIGGPQRSDRPTVVRIDSGDVLLMGPPSRLLFHGVRRIHPGTSPLPGLTDRISLTFRRAL